MSLTAHLWRAAHKSPPGIAVLANALGLAESSLHNKVSMTNHGAHCSPEEMAGIMELTGDHGALHSLAARLGYVLLAMPQMASEADQGYIEDAARTMRECGEFIAAATAGMSDGKVTDNELRGIQKECAELIAAAQRVMAMAERINQDGKPQAERAATGLRGAS